MTTPRSLLAMALAVCASTTASAGQPYFLADGYGGNVHRLEDLNGDDDALDAGERTVWASNLVNAFELTRYGPGLLATDATTGRLQRMLDLNGDGDALDAGEVTTWAQGFGFLNGVTVDRQNAVYFTDYLSADRVYRAVDRNNDGDALDAGEVTLFNDGIVGPVSVLARRDDVLVTSYSLGQVHRLFDADHDGDALDAGENLVHTPLVSAQLLGLLPAANGAYFVGSLSGNAIFRVEDANGDGDALDAAEVRIYTDNIYGSINGSWGLAPRPGGGLLAANYTGVGVVGTRDNNGDGDALDVGESLLFADGLTGLAGIVVGLGPGPADRMITIQASAGTLDVAAPNFVAIVEGSTLRNTAITGRLNAGTSVLVSTAAPATLADGKVYQSAGAPIGKTVGGAATLTIRADDSIELAGGISSTSGALNVVLIANDATLAYRDNNTAAGDVVISAAVNTNGGSFTSSGVNFNNSGGNITAGSMTLVQIGTITIGAAVHATSLNLSAAGGLNVTPAGQLVGANAINGSFANAGQLAPGASPGILSISGNFTQLSTGHLAIELGGQSAGVNYDRLQVGGNATLAGALDVTLINGFVPSLGNLFTVLTFGLRSGDFTTYTGVAIGGHLTLRRSFSPTGLSLIARPSIDGDINLDGTVDIFDINSVSSNWSTTGPQGDANGDGIVNIFDVNLISSNWGATGAVAVPEPTAWIPSAMGLLGLFVFGWRCRRRRRPRRSH